MYKPLLDGKKRVTRKPGTQGNGRKKYEHNRGNIKTEKKKDGETENINL